MSKPFLLRCYVVYCIFVEATFTRMPLLSQKHLPQLPLSLINGEALSREQTVKYLGVNFNSKLTCSTHIDPVFTKCLKMFFFI